MSFNLRELSVHSLYSSFPQKILAKRIRVLYAFGDMKGLAHFDREAFIYYSRVG